MKRYGDTKTALVLSSKAQAAYELSDPVDIYEIETGDGGTVYNMRGVIEAGSLTGLEVNEMLESLYDDCLAFDCAAELMDDAIREEIHMSGAFDGDPAGFLAEYERRHLEKFGVPFEYV